MVELLAKQGYTNVGLVNRSGKLPSPVPEGVQRIEVAKADAADAHAVVAALDELKSKFGAPACVVHNVASVEMGPKDTLDLTPEVSGMNAQHVLPTALANCLRLSYSVWTGRLWTTSRSSQSTTPSRPRPVS